MYPWNRGWASFCEPSSQFDIIVFLSKYKHGYLSTHPYSKVNLSGNRCCPLICSNLPLGMKNISRMYTLFSRVSWIFIDLCIHVFYNTTQSVCSTIYYYYFRCRAVSFCSLVTPWKMYSHSTISNHCTMLLEWILRSSSSRSSRSGQL